MDLPHPHLTDKGTGLSDTYIKSLMDKAFVARMFLLFQAIYFVAVGLTFEGEDRYFFGYGALDARAAFVVAAGAALVMLFSKRHPPRTVAVVMFFVGYATLLRGFDVVLDVGTPFGARVRAVGWLLMWLATVVSITHMIAAEALRSSPRWTS